MILQLEPSIRIEKSGLSSRLAAYKQLLFAENESINLVSRETDDAGFLKLAAESLLPLDQLNEGARSYLDIGSGGGFPAIPVMLARRFPTESLLVERTQKKAAALERICGKLGLRVRIEPINLADLSVNRQFELITLRYVSLDHDLLKRIRSLLHPGGTFIYYSKPTERDLLGLRCITTEYQLSGDPVTRHFSILQHPKK